MRTGSTSTISSREVSRSTDSALSEEMNEGFVFPAASPLMAKVRSSISQVARVDVPVLLLGESGVGKEVVARRIHCLSRRADRTLLIVNCAALPAELLESELFGYEVGAFTGAVRSKPGQFELCNKGTILLDEIGELPPSLQAKLLHVLQGGQFSRLGGRSLIEVDVRILAATNVNVPQALASKRLREDLYYRLSALTIHLPPLRERPEEIPVFLQYFMERFAAQLGRAPKVFPPRVFDACMRYSWPGNVRELENFVKRFLILGDEDPVAASPISNNEYAAKSPAKNAPPREAGSELWSLRAVKAEAEKEAILQALEETRWRRKDAAQRLRISMKALYNKLRLYGIGTEEGEEVLLKEPELPRPNTLPIQRREVPCRRAT
jgi:two-component system, NtrC family, response regulator AtoC